MSYTVDYFIKKFEAIPEGKWCRGKLVDQNDPDCHCALGHCGVTERDYDDPEVIFNPLFRGGWLMTEEAVELVRIFGGNNVGDGHVVYGVNDRDHKSPKENILSHLYYIKNNKPA